VGLGREVATSVTGAVLLVVVLVVVIPAMVLMAGALLSAIVGWSLQERAVETHPGSELTGLWG
jgi:hypothetical protein